MLRVKELPPILTPEVTRMTESRIAMSVVDGPMSKITVGSPPLSVDFRIRAKALILCYVSYKHKRAHETKS